MFLLKVMLITALLVLLMVVLALAQKPQTDAQAARLKGSVREVKEESDPAVKQKVEWAATGRHVTSIRTYDPQGNQLTSKLYDHNGNLFQTTTCLKVDGYRAAKSELIHQGFNPPPEAAAPPRAGLPDQEIPKPDPRYDTKYVDTYDSQGHRIEVLVFHNTGAVNSLHVSKFDERGNEIEFEQWSPLAELKDIYRRVSPPRDVDKLPHRTVKLPSEKTVEMARNTKSVFKYDEQGNLQEAALVKDDGTLDYRQVYSKYEFDAQGNWIKRVCSKVVSKDGKETLEPERVEYRTIRYYQKTGK